MTGNKHPLVLVQPRERVLFLALVLLRFVDCCQAMAVAGFRSVTRANARLLLLTKAGLLRRTFVGTINSGRKAIYALSETGALLVGVDYSSIKRSSHQLRLGDFYYEHQLKLNDIYIKLKYPQLPLPATLLLWRAFARPIDEGIALVPDAYFELRTAAAIQPCFLEVDLGTETRKIWQQKIDSYLSLATSGSFTRLFAHPQFRVLIITTTDTRAEHLRQLICRRTSKIFWLTTFSKIARDGLFAQIWQRPSQGPLQPLIEPNV